MRETARTIATALLLLLACQAPLAVAARAQAEERRVVLTVSGAVSKMGDGGGGAIDYTREELEALGTTDLVTETPFTKGEVHLSGVPLKRLLEAVGARGETIHAVALNDYAVDIPSSDATRYGVLLATRAEGKPLPVHDKGPVWVVYPWSQRPELASPTYNARSIWQVRRLEIR